MARRILTFFVLVMLTFGLAAYLILGQALDELRGDHQRRQEQMHQQLAVELSYSYQLLDALVRQRMPFYRGLHREALTLLSAQGDNPRLDLLQARLSEQAGFSVHIYLIGDNRVVDATTFTPDQGLDFKQSGFADVRTFLDRVDREQKILIGQPTQDMPRQRYTLYSYSSLPGGGYLELGFSDPDINRYFERFFLASTLHPDAEVELFMDYWGELLTRLGRPTADDEKSRSRLTTVEQPTLAGDYGHFRRAIESGSVQRVQALDDEGHRSTQLYTRLLSLNIEGGLVTHFLSKVTFDDRAMARMEAHVVCFFWVLLLLAVTFMAALGMLVRHHLAVPIQRMVWAIRKGNPVDLSRWRRSPELHFLAESYNRSLSQNTALLSELSRQSRTDPLTGLLNRRCLHEIFTHEQARTARSGNQLGFAMIDVDFFKPYNDLYGHLGGDRVLKQVADMLSMQFRRAGDFVFRVGGEEFAVLVTAPGTTSLPAQFEQMCKLVVAEKIPHHGSAIADILTISIGLKVVQPGEQITLEEALAAADLALYRAKGGGRNQIQVVPDTDASLCNNG